MRLIPKRRTQGKKIMVLNVMLIRVKSDYVILLKIIHKREARVLTEKKKYIIQQ